MVQENPIWVVTEDSVVVQRLGSSPRKVYRKDGAARFKEVLDIIESREWDRLDVVLDLEKDVEEKVREVDGLHVEGEHAYYRGEQLDRTLSNKIVSLVRSGSRDLTRFTRFVERIMENPSRISRNELYSFLEYKELPILDDGRFLAYKGVRANYTDKWSGKFDNTTGAINSMPRRDVDDDRGQHCSYGFHVGSYDYAKGFMGDDGRLMFVAIDPKNVVSIPDDCQAQKCRVCEYEVVGEDHELVELRKPEYVTDDEGQYDLTNDVEEPDYDERRKIDRMLIHSMIMQKEVDGVELSIENIIDRMGKGRDTREYVEGIIKELGYVIPHDSNIHKGAWLRYTQ